jgi:hypothetical protein
MMIPWYIKAREFSNCNCDYGCPCQFNALPTHGDCKAIAGYQIDKGTFGDTKLDGLRIAAVYSWPGPIHEGGGQMQLIVDERADEAQRDALLKIMMGEETEEMATMWAVFTQMVTDVKEPLFRPVEFEVDVDNRTAKLIVPGLIEARGEPIRNSVTGELHRARIDLPNGFEFLMAEMGSGTSKSTGEIELEFTDSYGQFANIELNNSGVVRDAA